MHKKNKYVMLVLMVLILPTVMLTQISSANSKVIDSLYYEYLRLKNYNIFELNTVESHLKNIPAKKCGFETAVNVKSRFGQFTSQQKSVLKTLMDRPQLQEKILSPSGLFWIHFNTTDSLPSYEPNLTPLQNAELIAEILDSVYIKEVLEFGFPMPPADFGNGGDDRYDIYIADKLGSYGYTQFEDVFRDNSGRDRITSYLVIDNNYSKDEGFNSLGFNGAAATLAHEFHHAIQLGNYTARFNENDELMDVFFFEMTSTAMEEFVFDYVNDYYAYMNTYYRFPQRPIYNYDGYEIANWDIFLKERIESEEIKSDIKYYEVIKRQWELLDQYRALKTIELSLLELGTTFATEFNTFGAWNYFTQHRAIVGQYFEEAENYPLLKLPLTINFTPPNESFSINAAPTSNYYLPVSIEKVINGNTSYDSLLIIVTNTDVESALNKNYDNGNAQLTLYNYNSNGAKKISDNYYLLLESNNININSSEILNNIYNRAVNPIGNIVNVFPNPFNYDQHNFIYIPADKSETYQADLYIYTSNMNLVYHKKEQVINYGNGKSIRWQPVNDKGEILSTGVYIFVTDSDGNINTGKIAILR